MTVIKATSTLSFFSKSSEKGITKRAVSFSKACKYSFPAQAGCSMHNDVFLQSTDKRRKYMRRGSKSPAMLQFASGQVESIEEEASVEKTNTDYMSNPGRRLSLMSALQMNFEKSANIDSYVASKIPRMSMDQQRRSAHELISKA
jgi:hypothetical protein